MFTGFPPEALMFFRGLARNNRREWFQPRKEIFENTVRQPMIELVEALNAGFAKLAPEYITDPRKAIYRIYRDTRFSSDKTPYKTHLAASFPRRGDRRSGPGFYFSLSLKELGVAGGFYDPTPERLLAVRAWLADNHERFRKAARGAEKFMGKLHGESLQRIPKGFDAAPGRRSSQNETVAVLHYFGAATGGLGQAGARSDETFSGDDPGSGDVERAAEQGAPPRLSWQSPK